LVILPKVVYLSSRLCAPDGRGFRVCGTPVRTGNSSLHTEGRRREGGRQGEGERDAERDRYRAGDGEAKRWT